LKEKYREADSLLLRPFGVQRYDLDVRFDEPFRAGIVTKVLQCCTLNTDYSQAQSLDESFFWDLSLGKRIECLLYIASLSDSHDPSIDIPCSNQLCRKSIGVDLSMQEMSLVQKSSDNLDRITVKVSDKYVSLRKPTGFDQRDLFEAQITEEPELARRILQRLILDEGGGNCLIDSAQQLIMKDGSLAEIDEAMSKVDQLINFTISVNCPYCQHYAEYEVDLEEVFLERLRVIQRRLIYRIHIMAKSYHWTEEQFFEIPTWRVTRYISLIEKGESGIDWLFF